MAIVYVESNENYPVKTDDQVVSMEVIIGDGQTGTYIILLEQDLKGTDETADLGNKPDIVGKNGIAVVNIPDTVPETKWTSVTINIIEGGNKTTFGPYEKEVPNNGDTAIYTTKILFS